jgi:DNA-binding transcriptional ArsR family regulator
MTNNRSALLPVLRSETQARLLAALLLHADREASIVELATEIGANPGNLHADVNRLVDAGILADRRVGRTRLIRDARSIFSEPLAQLLLLAYGPKALLEEAIQGISSINTAYLFGSWAARYLGIQGAQPNDIDLLVIGTPDRDDVYEKAQAAAAVLRREVQVVFRSQEAWDEAIDGFVTTVKSRPLVELDLTTSGQMATTA